MVEYRRPWAVRLAIAAWGVTGAIMSFGCSFAAAAGSQVTYALPNGTGHDTLENGVAAAWVAGIASVVCVVAAVGAASGRVRPLWCAIAVAVGVIAAAVALLLFAMAPRPVY